MQLEWKDLGYSFFCRDCKGMTQLTPLLLFPSPLNSKWSKYMEKKCLCLLFHHITQLCGLFYHIFIFFSTHSSKCLPPPLSTSCAQAESLPFPSLVHLELQAGHNRESLYKNRRPENPNYHLFHMQLWADHTIIKSSELEGTSEGQLVQLPCNEQEHHS